MNIIAEMTAFINNVMYQNTLKKGVLMNSVALANRQKWQMDDSCLAQGFRQDQLATVAGVGVRLLVELERGKPTVRLANVLAVLEALGCRLQVTGPPAATRSDW